MNAKQRLELMKKAATPTQPNPKVRYVDSVLNANQKLDWVRRLFEKNTPSIVLPNETAPSTHFMESADNFAYPTIVRRNGKLEYLGKDAYDYAMKTGEFIKFKSPQEANWFAANGYKMGTNVLKKK